MIGENGSNGRVEIPLGIVGCDFRIASSSCRQEVLSTPEDRQSLLQSLRKIDTNVGLMVLETCNRVEWIVASEHPGWLTDILMALMVERWRKSNNPNTSMITPYVYTGKDAVVHVLKVVVGAESLAAGEAQIAGQFQNALTQAQKEKMSTPILNRLGSFAGRMAKNGYKIGFRSCSNQGIHGLVADFIEHKFPEPLKGKTVLVAGMGNIGRKTAELLKQLFPCTTIALNRTIDQNHEGEWQPLSDLEELSHRADFLVMATGGRKPVVTLKSLNLANRSTPLRILDIGIPLQVSPEVREHPMVEYFNIDHFVNKENRVTISKFQDKLDTEIQKELNRFRQFCRERELERILAEIQLKKEELTEKKIPEIICEKLPELDSVRQKQVESSLNHLVQQYSNSIFTAFHNTLEKFWSKNEQYNQKN